MTKSSSLTLSNNESLNHSSDFPGREEEGGGGGGELSVALLRGTGVAPRNGRGDELCGELKTAPSLLSQTETIPASNSSSDNSPAGSVSVEDGDDTSGAVII